ncbi:unnamed protein product [marine sediment metagenome]|uniref:Uncharacterized protein n=1 Tax=marine sediment metagenome TaxID=412755 RepID=X0WMY4_9ZZZZ
MGKKTVSQEEGKGKEKKRLQKRKFDNGLDRLWDCVFKLRTLAVLLSEADKGQGYFCLFNGIADEIEEFVCTVNKPIKI